MYGENNLTQKKMSKLPEATPEQRETLHRKAIGKHKETHVEYEIFLRHGDEEGEFFVDVREDIVDSDGEIINGGEYIEGFIFDAYEKAKEKFIELGRVYEEQLRDGCHAGSVNYYDEIEHG